jgi:hypothetical protein
VVCIFYKNLDNSVYFHKYSYNGQLFLRGFEKFPGGGKIFAGGLPPPGSDIPESSWGDFNVPCLLVLHGLGSSRVASMPDKHFKAVVYTW